MSPESCPQDLTSTKAAEATVCLDGGLGPPGVRRVLLEPSCVSNGCHRALLDLGIQVQLRIQLLQVRQHRCHKDFDDRLRAAHFKAVVLRSHRQELALPRIQRTQFFQRFRSQGVDRLPRRQRLQNDHHVRDVVTGHHCALLEGTHLTNLLHLSGLETAGIDDQIVHDGVDFRHQRGDRLLLLGGGAKVEIPA